MENLNEKKTYKVETNIGMDEIEIKYIKKFLLRNLKIIISIISSGFFIGVIYSLLEKEVWKGEFQIVLEDDSFNGISTLSLPSDAQKAFSQIRSAKVTSKLSTQVEILKSPSVLMSVFEFVKDNKVNKKKNITFRDWRRDLNIQLQKETTVLNIGYQDEDKALILPVLNNISQKYQSYSGNKSRSQIKKGLDYLTDQINLYTLKSKNATNNAQLFSITNEMPFPEITQGKKESKVSSTQIGFFNTTVQDANNLKIIDNQIKRISNIDDPFEIISFAKNINNFKTENFEKSIDKLSRIKTIYNDDYKYVKELEKEIESRSKLVKKMIINDLISKQYLTSARRKVNERPTEIILKYQDLWQKAIRNKEVLNNLEDQFIALKLDEARDRAPWDLITNPTLLDKRIYPNRKSIVFSFFLFSSVIAIIASYFSEKIKNRIFKISEFENLIPFNLIENLSFNNENLWKENLDNIVKSNLLSNESKKILIITLGEDMNTFGTKFGEFLGKKYKEKTFEVSNKIETFSKYDQQIILCKEGINREELNQFLRRLKFYENNIVGWFLIED